MKTITFIMMVLLVIFGFKGNKKVSYKKSSKLYIASVTNNIKIGPHANNKTLTLGVKNVLAEAAQERGWDIVSDEIDAEVVLKAEMLYLDVEQTKSNLSVFHKDENAVIIKMRGLVYDETGKLLKNEVAEAKSTETSTSAFLIDEGGQFNSQVARQAVKKTCVLLAYRIL